MMPISSVSSNNSPLYTQATQSTQETDADRQIRHKKSKHEEEQAQNVNTQAASPTVNTSGNTTGQLINTTA